MSLIQVFFRQVVLYFPLLYGLNALFGPVGLVAAYPVAEVFSSIISTILLERKMKRVKAEFEREMVH
jgi:Na+-driven multidrug efflux pump